MRFEVPQFIDVEDKLFGPLTFKQFIYLAGGVGLAYVCYKLIFFPLGIILALVCIGLALALAFYKLNNRPFIEVAQSYLAYKFKSKLYVWKRSPPPKTPPKPAASVPVPVAPEKKFDEKTVEELANNLDILDSYQK